MPQLRNPLQEVTIPFAKMSFTPDIPAGSLSPTEYNHGLNVQTDIRGIRSVMGEEEIAQALTGTPVYITGGYRQDSYWYYIVACISNTNEGRWYQIHWDGTNWITENVTPGYALNPTVYFPGYTTDINITEAWNGTTLIINDGINPPMFLQGLATEFVEYKLNQDVTVYTIFPISTTTMIIQTNEYLPGINVPYSAGERITVEQVVYPYAFNSTYTILNMYTTSSYDFEVDIPAEVITCDFVGDITGTTLTVSTVNSGSINVGDDIGYAGQTLWTTIIQDYGGGVYEVDQTLSLPPGTAFVSTQAYTQGGLIRPEYQWNYNPDWTALSAGFLRSFSSPNVGSILIAGNLTATDVNAVTSQYPNTVRWSQQFGLDQVPATWTPTIANIANELEVPLRGPVLDGFPCNGNFFVCSYWDTVVFAPINYQTTQIPILGCKLFNQGRGLLNSNCWVNADDTVYGLDARDLWVFNGQDFKPLGNQRIKNYLFDNLNPLYTNQVFLEFNAYMNQVEIYYPDLTSTGYCNKMLSYRYDLDVFNPPRTVPDVIMATEGPIYRSSPYNEFDPGSRCVAFVRAVADSLICQKDQGYSFVGGTPIVSEFRRDSIRLVEDYSTMTMVHRVMPIAINVNEYALQTASTGSIDITVGGANSAGATIVYKPVQTLDIDTEYPWVQINQNVFRQNTLIIADSSTTESWLCSAVAWQYTPVEDDR